MAGQEEVAEPGPVPGLDHLPAPVRTRVVALAARVLPDVPDLPGPLRSVASFTPARRARRGAGAIATALDDDDFRHRVGTQALPVVAPDAPDAERAALLWLTGDAPDALAALVDRVTAGEPAPDPRLKERVARLRSRVEAGKEELREERARHRAEIADLKEQNRVLRRSLGETRSGLREARARAQEREAGGEETEREQARAEAEARRLRAQVEDLTGQLERLRSAGRSERDAATLRARLLLDTVVDAAAGLRRELALPAVEGSPAARVEDELAAREGARTPTAAGALGAQSPALLAQLLTAPRARLVIDGYNVSKTAWETSSLEAQRTRLLQALAPLVARTGVETTVVFDAAAVEHRPVVAAPRGVRVLFSPYGVLADDVIRDLVAAEPAGRPVVVVTSDQEVARDVVDAGFRAVGSPALVGLLGRV